jgi:hypothetical protein
MQESETHYPKLPLTRNKGRITFIPKKEEVTEGSRIPCNEGLYITPPRQVLLE